MIHERENVLMDFCLNLWWTEAFSSTPAFSMFLKREIKSNLRKGNSHLALNMLNK